MAKEMIKASRSAVKTLVLNKSRDIVVDRLIKPCEVGNHSKCTGWAVLKKEVSPIDANYFLRCTCTCHKKEQPKKSVWRKMKKKQKPIKRSKKSKRASNR